MGKIEDSSSYIRVRQSPKSETNQVREIEWINDVLNMIAAFLEKEYKAQTSKLTGLIYMHRCHRINDIKLQDTSGRNLRMFHKLCGQNSLNNVVIVTTIQAEVTSAEGWPHEQELLSSDSLLKPLVDGGAVVKRHDGARRSASEIIDYLLSKEHTTPQIVRELVHEHKTLEETAAGIELQTELRASLRRHRRELETLENELKSVTTPLAKRELVGRKKGVEQSISSLNHQLNGLTAHFGSREISPLDGLPTSASVGGNLLEHDFTNHSSGGNGAYLQYATVVPRDHFSHSNDVEPVSIDRWRRFQSSNTLPLTQTDCIANCIQLFHYVNSVPDISVIRARDDIAGRTIAWLRNFAGHVERSVGNAQNGHVTLKDAQRIRNPHELQNFANDFVNATMATLDDWRSSYASLEKMFHDYQTSLRKKPSKLSWWLNGRKVRRRREALVMIIGTIKLLLGDIASAIDWWMSFSDEVKIWEDAACLLTSGRSFNDGLEGELIYPIHVLDSYSVTFQSLSERLRSIVDNVAEDQHSSGGPVIRDSRGRRSRLADLRRIASPALIVCDFG